MYLVGRLLADNSWQAMLLGNRALGIAVWVGAAVLTLALLILMRTRWGQAQPVSKCVVLSIFAHVLLFLYAYGTRLLDDRPQLGGDDAIQLAFVATDQPPREGDAAAEPQPWEEFVAGDPSQPESVDSDRVDPDTGQITRASHVGPWTMGAEAMPQETPPETEPPRPVAEKEIPTPEPSRQSPVQPATIGPTEMNRSATREPVVPEPQGPQRIQTAPVVRRSMDQDVQAELPTEMVAVGSSMQQLSSAAARSETADALVGTIDRLSESENRGSSRVDSTGIVRDRPQNAGNGAGAMVTLPMHARPSTGIVATAPVSVEQVLERPARRLGDGQPMPQPYLLRNVPQREQIALGLGSSVKAAAAVESALDWLAAEQERDGRWDASRWGAGVEHKVAGHDREGAGTDADTGITGLAVLAFMANGQTHLEGKYRKNVQRGLEFLLRSQSDDGSLAGQARLYASMYCHGMASLALSEALALTGDVRIKPYVQRAVDFTVESQHATSGGWRYQPGDQGDMSQFGWQVMALKSAAMAGISIPHSTREGMLHFLQRCEQGHHGGLAGYRPGTPASRPMSAEALVCRYFLDLAPNRELVSEAADFITGELPQSGVPNLYYWYYGTLALFQVQGEPWSKWNEAMQRQLLRLQRTDGHLAGSWDPDTIWGAYGGRAYSTAMAALCLEVYYRYLPMTTISQTGDQPAF